MWTFSDKNLVISHMYLKLMWKSLMYIHFSGHKNSQVDTHGQTHTHMRTQKSQMTHFSISCHGHPAFPQLESTIQLLGSNYPLHNLPIPTRKKKWILNSLSYYSSTYYVSTTSHVWIKRWRKLNASAWELVCVSVIPQCDIAVYTQNNDYMGCHMVQDRSVTVTDYELERG